MLKKLSIKNFTLIKNIDIGFNDGLVVMTGETGAGKSIIINAIQLLLGGKGEFSYIREGQRFAVIEGIFLINENVRKILEDKEIIADSDEINITRQLNRSGKNRIMVNDQPVALKELKEITRSLIDIHGQHKHQSLLDEGTHIRFFDQTGDYHSILEEYEESFSQYQGIHRRYFAEKKSLAETKERIDLYHNYLKEIEAYRFEKDEDKKLENKINILGNSELLKKVSEDVFYHIYENDDSLLSAMKKMLESVLRVKDIDKQINDIVPCFEQALINLEEIGQFFMNYREHVEHDPKDLNESESRLADIEKMSYKFKRNLNELINYQDELRTKIDHFDLNEKDLETLEENLSEEEEKLMTLAVLLTEKRKKHAVKFEKRVTDKLRVLGMKDAGFKVEFTPLDSGKKTAFKDFVYNERGDSFVRFLINTNPGHDFQPLAKIASGGEISRVMLAIKSVLSDGSDIDTMIFDEIDTGISGKAAEKVGVELKALAGKKQVVCITHLHQIASLGGMHLVVSKNVKQGITSSEISEVQGEERINEIAVMMGGEKVTKTIKKHAEELLTKGGSFG